MCTFARTLDDIWKKLFPREASRGLKNKTYKSKWSINPRQILNQSEARVNPGVIFRLIVAATLMWFMIGSFDFPRLPWSGKEIIFLSTQSENTVKRHQEHQKAWPHFAIEKRPKDNRFSNFSDHTAALRDQFHAVGLHFIITQHV